MFQPVFDEGPHYRAQIGFLAVANADLTERDMFGMKPEGVGVHFSRVMMPEAASLESLRSTGDYVADATSVLMPARRDLDVICYNCTAGSFAVGEESIIRKINEVRPDVKATTMFTGVLHALDRLNASRVALGTPYTEDITALEVECLEASGIGVTAHHSLSLLNDQQMNRLAPDFIREFAIAIDTPDADAVFISCGAIRSVDIIDSVEQTLGKPVICSNQASMWHCLQLAGISASQSGPGMLFKM